MLKTWLCDSLERIHPASRPKHRGLRLDVARGERFSFQVGAIVGDKSLVQAAVSSRSGLAARIRRVGWVPLPAHSAGASPEQTEGYDHIPGLVPDILFDDVETVIPPHATSAYWISGTVPLDCRPGPKKIRVTVTPEPCHGGPQTLEAVVRVHTLRLQPRRNFDVIHWFYADALCDWYGVEPWSAGFWRIVEPYMRNAAQHGQNTIYVPVFTPPLDGVKRPTQLLGVKRVAKDVYRFDWSNVRKWIRTAQRCGIEKFEWCHLFTQWGVQHAIRVYEKGDGEDVLLWPPDTAATGATYRRFLSQFLPALHRFLQREKLLENSFFHLSDEPHGDEHLANYRKARRLLHELAPWMKVMDALSDIRFAREGLVDMPIPIVSEARNFIEEDLPCWTYFCCGPGGDWLNRLLDTPLTKIRMSGWLFYRFANKGFLHWGYNYWYRKQTRQLIDPFFVTDGAGWPAWAHGDTFVVYPGGDGPIDSIRWEIFAESLQDYQLLQTLGVKPESLARDFNDFDEPAKSVAWLRNRRRKLLEGRARSRR